MFSQMGNIVNMIANAGLVVQLVMLILICFSIVSWAIIFIKYVFIKKAYKESVLFVNSFWKELNLSKAYEDSKKLQNSPIAKVFATGFLELKKLQKISKNNKNSKQEYDSQIRFSNTDNVKRALRRAKNSELTKLNQLIPFLATAGNTAPFIGLFGTVWGIMEAFHNIGITGASSIAVVAPGISEALIATAAGLAVAIPAVIGFNYFVQQIKIIDSELESFAADFLNIIVSDILSE